MLDKFRDRLPPQTRYFRVQFPLAYVGGGMFKFHNCEQQFSIHPHGLNYLIYRLYGYDKKTSYIDKDHARELFEWKMEEFTKYINFCARKMKSLHFKEARRKSFVAAINMGALWGLMTDYNAVPHREVLDMVEQAGLADKVVSLAGKADPNEMVLLVQNRKELETIGGHYGLAIRNGETGHVALGYEAYVQAHNYLFTWPLRATNRHLSKVHNALDALKEALDECHSIDVVNMLKTRQVRTLKLKTTDSEIQSTINRHAADTAAVLVSKLTPLTTGYGHKTEAKKVLDQIFKQLTKGK